MSPQLVAKTINVECVLFDSSCTPPLFLEKDLGQGYANYWTDDINDAMVFNSLPEALPVFKRLSYKGNVEIKELVKNDTDIQLKIGRYEYTISADDVFSDNGVRILLISQKCGNGEHIKLTQKAQKIINQFERIPLDSDWFKLKIT